MKNGLVQLIAVEESTKIEWVKLVFNVYISYLIKTCRRNRLPSMIFFITTPGSTFKTTCLAVPTRIFPLRIQFGGGRVVQWCWVNFHCRGQRPTSLPVGAVGGCLDIKNFLSSIISIIFLPLSGIDGWMSCDLTSILTVF